MVSEETKESVTRRSREIASGLLVNTVHQGVNSFVSGTRSPFGGRINRRVTCVRVVWFSIATGCTLIGACQRVPGSADKKQLTSANIRSCAIDGI